MVSRGGDSKDAAELARRRDWFRAYATSLEETPRNLPLRCPCCMCRTLDERAAYEICPVCFWEDDGQDEHEADVVRGGPNGGLSLSTARANYRRVGACAERNLKDIRPPRKQELADV